MQILFFKLLQKMKYIPYIAIALMFFFIGFKLNKVEVIKTKIKYDTITQIVDNTKPQQIKTVKVKVPIEVPKIINNYDTITEIVYKEVQTNEYKYKDVLKNGIIEETILADNIYKRDVKLTTFDKTIEKTVIKSNFYIGGTTTLNFDKSFSNASLGLFYSHKNKFLLGTSLGHNLKQPNVNLTLAIKL